MCSERPLFYPEIFNKEWTINNQFRIDHPDKIKSHSEEEVRFQSPEPFQPPEEAQLPSVMSV
jgi:hypothetical protein